MLNKGDRIRILPDLPLSAYNYSNHIVHERRGTLATVKEQDVLSINRWWVTPEDQSVSNFWVMTEWVELYTEPQEVGCVCPIIELFNRGCKCGQMDRERKNVQKG